MREKILEIIYSKSDDILELRRELFAIFNKVENKNYNPDTTTIIEEEEIIQWIAVNDVNFVGFKKKENSSRVFVSEVTKASFLAQNYCKICDEKGTISNFPIRIIPITRQTTTAFKNEFKQQFANSPYGKNTNLINTDKLCVKLVFVLNNVRDKDVDNMAKITLDALKELIGIDDKNIDHLELIKIKTKYLESFIMFRISKSDINTNDNVILKGAHMSWAGLPQLNQ